MKQESSVQSPAKSKVFTKSDIYDMYTTRQKTMILAAGGLVSMLTPFTDTIYLPALSSVQRDLRTTAPLVSLSVSVYLGCVGLGQLIWGPLSDRYGRSKVLFGSLFVYEGFTLACIFVKTISALIVVRGFQGLIVGATIVIVQAIISDVFRGDERGMAMGAFLGPLLIGPIVAPLIGGILSQTYTWR